MLAVGFLAGAANPIKKASAILKILGIFHVFHV